MIILFHSDDIYSGVSLDCPFELLDIHTDYKDISYPDVLNGNVLPELLLKVPGIHIPCMCASSRHVLIAGV